MLTGEIDEGVSQAQNMFSTIYYFEGRALSMLAQE